MHVSLKLNQYQLQCLPLASADPVAVNRPLSLSLDDMDAPDMEKDKRRPTARLPMLEDLAARYFSDLALLC